MEDLAEFVETAHKNGIRVLLDLVYAHIGPNGADYTPPPGIC